MVVAGAGLALELCLWASFGRDAEAQVWFAVVSAGLLVVSFGAGPVVARASGASTRIQLLMIAGLVLSVAGQLAAAAK